MDISVLASVGSFVVSERVLKPKASILIVLGCVLAYDLTTKTHDISSLRVYRGPGLLAFTLMMVAYSLRTWRRNGVACDELLFLPGTPHGADVTTGEVVLSSSMMSNSNNNNNSAMNRSSSVSSNHPNHHHRPLQLQQQVQQQQQLQVLPIRSEGDVAAGGIWINPNSIMTTTNTTTTNTTTTNHTNNSPQHPPVQRSFSQRSRARSLSNDSSLSSIHEFVNSWGDEDDVTTTANTTTSTDTNNNRNNNYTSVVVVEHQQQRDTTTTSSNIVNNNNNHNQRNDRNEQVDNDDDDDEFATNEQQHLMIPLTRSTDSNDHNNHNNNHTLSNTKNSVFHMLSSSSPSSSSSPKQYSHNNNNPTITTPSSPNNNNNNNNSSMSCLDQQQQSQQQQQHTRVERFRENHPNVTRIGSFFFFRSSTTSTHNATYAPSGPSVVGAAIDLSMPVLFNFHLFIEAWNHIDSTTTTSTSTDTSSGSSTTTSDDATAKILPLIFLSVLIVRSFFPPGRRGRFWSTMKYTGGAPFYHSRFRDCYIGDVLTSLVRPFQDVVFALAYYVTVIWGSISSKYNLTDSGRILESSWILHNAVLPTIAMLPLWWKFLQTLRESYDTGKRWPYLGNAFKYFSAAIVILYGMTHPEDRRSVWWIIAFGITLFYQIFWDTVMDWDLFVIAPKDVSNYYDSTSGLDISESTMWFNRPISSVRSDSYWLLSIQRHILPIRECIRSWLIRLPSFHQIQIRPRRLYKSETFYWRIFIYNTIFRFCWMLSFIPAYHLSTPSEHRDDHNNHVRTTFSSDTNSYVGVLLPIAEILRRTLWGFLYLEIQTIKLSDGEECHQLYTSVLNPNNNNNALLLSTNDDNTCNDSIELPASMSKQKMNSSLRYNNNNNNNNQQQQYIPAWLGMQQQLQHEAAMQNGTSSNTVMSMASSTGGGSTTTNISSSSSKIGGWFHYSESVRHKLFLMELSLWAVAFVGIGIWATL